MGWPAASRPRSGCMLADLTSCDPVSRLQFDTDDRPSAGPTRRKPHDPAPALRSADGHRRRTRDDARVPARHRPARLRRVPAARHRGRSRRARRLLRAVPRPRPAARRPRGGRHAHVAGEPRLGRTPRLRRDPARRRQPARRRVRARARHQRSRRSGGARRRRRGRPARRRLRGRRDDVGVRGGGLPRPAGTRLRRGRRRR